ncbi:MAG: hypothetical protein J6B43_03235 [Lachnospiraceae bacterium]|nr:hypothetical protein [Lachnospiraceae bacterium]
MNEEEVRSVREMIRMQMQKAQERGVSLYVDDHPASPEEVACKCVQEQTVYMPDYVLNDMGILEQVRFDRIDPQ